jgi:hypothetical protein
MFKIIGWFFYYVDKHATPFLMEWSDRFFERIETEVDKIRRKKYEP